MIVVISYWLFLLSACLTMMIFGQTLERWFAATIVAATVLSFVLNNWLGMITASPFIVAIDVVIWGIALTLALAADRYWPIWFAGFHLNTIATEVGSIVLPGTIPALYANLAGAWALPALGFAAAGVARDFKARQSGYYSATN